MLDTTVLPQFRSFIQGSRRALNQCRRDLDYIKKYGRIAYHLDFSLLAPVFFKSTPIGVKQLFTLDREKYNALLKDKPSSSVLIAITGPTLWEFLDFLHHVYCRIKHIHELVLEADESLGSQIQLLTSDQITEYLKSLEAPKKISSVAQLERLLHEKILVGLGDVVKQPNPLSLQDTIEVEKLVTKQFSERDRDNDNRAEKDKRFHYRMDAINALITKAIQRHSQRVYFVTNNWSIRNYCTAAGNELIRDPWVPLFVKNLSKDISSGLEYIDEAICHYDKTINMIETERTHTSIFQQYATICYSIHTELSSSPFSSELKKGETGEMVTNENYKLNHEVSRLKLIKELSVERERLMSEAGNLENLSTKYDISYFKQLEIIRDEIIETITDVFELGKRK